jgi:hypothetical protein
MARRVRLDVGEKKPRMQVTEMQWREEKGTSQDETHEMVANN